MGKRIKEQDYSRLLMVDLTRSTMTVKQLRKYISVATKQFNKDLPRYKGAVRTSAEYILDNIGNYKGKLVNKTDRMNKTDLLSRAALLRGHFRIDADSLQIESELSEKSKQAYQTLKTTLGDDEDFTVEVYKELVKVLSGLGTAVLEKLDSFQVASMYNEYRYFGQSEASSLLDLIKQVYEDMLNDEAYKGLDKTTFSTKLTDLVKERLQHLI